ncbi:inositol transporter 4-like [Telopea speciosissima]|uniref:inositol transporter 4-like n=1 Tax=Telopea speciosissima TaxID=54955 RepID=UPI001CC806CC|nr:inositol transporter 4-like [Telopea speciosissima]
MAVAGAIVGAALGGLTNDKLGRRYSILIADVLFIAGAVIMALAWAPWVILLGRIFVGLGVGMASMTTPLYISEVSPARIRGALVSTNGLLLTGGQFLSYLLNLGFTKVPGTWRWMLGVAAVPAFVQFILMWLLPESPRWLYRKNKKVEAVKILRKIYHPEDVDSEVEALRLSIEAEIAEESSIGKGNIFSKVRNAWSNVIVRRGLIAGVGIQVAQQFVGINTVMYYSPTIVQLAGFASNNTALALSLITSGLNAVGTILLIFLVDRFGRRRLLIISTIGMVASLVMLFVVFDQAAIHAPMVSELESSHFGLNATCSSYLTANDASSWNCMSCLKASSVCGFCANGVSKVKPGACLASNTITKSECHGEHREWFTRGCPSNFGVVALLGLAFYIIAYSPGMGTVPWIINSEIYPLKYRGLCGGMAAMANWISNLIVSQTFLTLTHALGSAKTFLLFGCFAFIALFFIYFFVPETKGLQFEEVEEMLRGGFKPWPLNKVSLVDFQQKGEKQDRQVEGLEQN